MELSTTDHLVVQHGHTPPRPELEHVSWLDFAPYEVIVDLCRQAAGVICHAGVGTIMTVLANGTTPVVISRLARYGEHVDDHQLQIAREFQARGMVVAAEEGNIRDALHRAAAARVTRKPPGALARAVAGAVDGERRLSRRAADSLVSPEVGS